MASELDTLDSSDIQPFNEGMPVLAPLSPAPDTWGRTDVLTNQEINDYQRQPQGPTLFGAVMPPGTSKQQVDMVLGQLGAAFMNDMSTLGYPGHMVQATIQFMTANATKAPYQVTPKHGFRLPKEADDWLGNAFGNMVHQLSGSLQAKQQFVTSCLQWLAKANKQLAGQQVTQSAQGSAPHSAEALLNQLSDADYAKVIKINEQALARTTQVLQQRWGDYTYQQNIQIAQDYLDRLPANERAVFDQFTTGWVHMRNTVECLTAIFDMAVNANSIGNSASIAQEIAAYESMLKIPSERQKYMRDPQMQARLRELYSRRGS